MKLTHKEALEITLDRWEKIEKATTIHEMKQIYLITDCGLCSKFRFEKPENFKYIFYVSVCGLYCPFFVTANNKNKCYGYSDWLIAIKNNDLHKAQYHAHRAVCKLRKLLKEAEIGAE